MMLTADLMRWFWTQYVQDERYAEDPGCSPLRASNLAGLPRAHVLTAEYKARDAIAEISSAICAAVIAGSHGRADERRRSQRPASR
jgi:acetyl esterase/lipase